MRQPIVISMRQRSSKFILRSIIGVTLLLLLILILMLFDHYNAIIVYVLFPLFVVSIYSIMIVNYYRVRTTPNFSIVIDEQGIHANKLFVPWNNIAAIYPVQVGIQKIEYVGIFPRDTSLMIRTSQMNPLLKLIYYGMVSIARLQGIPPVGLRPDTMSTQALLQQLWNNYYPEYQYYNISPYPLRRS